MQFVKFLVQATIFHYNNNLYFVPSLLLKRINTMKILKVKLEYWLPGITIVISGARQPVDICIKIEK